MRLIIVIAFLFPALLPAQQPKPGQTLIPPEVIAALDAHPGLTYASYGERTLQLDLYRPKNATQPLPAIICIHGGGWFKGERSNMTNLAQALAARGFVTAAISYRLSGEIKFPSPMHDCKAAVRYLRANAAKFGIQADAIGVTGLSAGGHLAALLATSGGVKELEGDGGHAEHSSAVQACIAMGAQSDLQTERIKALSRQPEDPFYRPFLGGNALDIPLTYALASPRHHLDAMDPPLAFMTGEQDHESTRADEMRRDLMNLGIPGGLTVIPQAPHAFLGGQRAFDLCVAGCDEFFTLHLKHRGQASIQKAEQLFVRRIVPLFHEKCLACHGNDEAKIKGDLDMRSLAAMLKGGESGAPSLVPGKPEESPLYLAATRAHDDWEAMPPKEADKLYEEQLGWIKDWIAGGAPWPDEARQKEIAKANEARWSAEDGITVQTTGALSPEWANRKYKPDALWGYEPVRGIGVMESGSNGVSSTPLRHPIDVLIAGQMPAGLEPAPAADARTLIRRATFDLTGLPPTPEEVAAFVNAFDKSDQTDQSDLFRALIDKLMQSPHYGERMAQHWLDVTRYADSSGFANDYERGSAWRYRDYVVRAFNSDKPYDRFIREQIAGDEIDPENPEMLVATGFLRMGPWELTGMEVARVARQRFLDDVTNSVGETFLAHSLQCARCHDHKFDPVPTHDYYSIQAVFATTQLAERSAAFLPAENTAGFDEEKHLRARQVGHTAMLREMDEKLLANARAWFAEKKLDATQWNAAVAQVSKDGVKDGRRAFQDHFSSARNLLMKQGVSEDKFPPKLVGFTPAEFGAERVARKGLERLKWELDRYQPHALSVYSGRTLQMVTVYQPLRMPGDRMTRGDLEETCILTGGDPFASGARVRPGVLSVLGSVQKTPIPDAIEGRRKAFADWVASAENPLTTRAIVNRVWMWHFGQPLAGNPNNFGSTGKKPTHPELLDWLAAKFVESGWSFKELHRLIMTSEVYRRTSFSTGSKPDELENSSYAVFQPRRLSAEELRDAMLAATGELNRTLGGIPNRPEINLEAALQPRQVMGTFASAWVPNPKPEQRHRRSLYALKLRGLTDPQLEVFNAPAPDFSCERREASTVTPQVFALFNSQATHSRALALANRAVKESATDEQAIIRVFQLVFLRNPNVEEGQSCLTHWHEIQALIGDEKPPAQKPPLKVRRDAVEENTGEKFSFDEELHAYAEFVPDLQPVDVDARTRALADVCLVLLNSNEFAYVY